MTMTWNILSPDNVAALQGRDWLFSFQSLRKPARRRRSGSVCGAKTPGRQLSPSSSPLVFGREDFHGECKRARFRRQKRTHTNDLARHFLAAFIADRHHHGILPRLTGCRWSHRPFDIQRRETRVHVLSRRLPRPQVMLAGGTNIGAFENRCPAVRTEPRLADCPLIYHAHVTLICRSPQRRIVTQNAPHDA